jgi:hypothetical protein
LANKSRIWRETHDHALRSRYIIRAIMQVFDPAGEWRELAERYHQMKDEELVILARQVSALTEVAQQALTQEVSYRKLEVPLLEAPAPPEPEPGPDDPYAEERALVEVRTVWSLRDALQLEMVLDRADIPFFMGPEKATGAEAVTSDFGKGVSVQVMRIGGYWAQQAMQNYIPADEPEEVPLSELEEIPVRCPKCRSTDVVIGRLLSEVVKEGAAPKFEWSCDSCGYEWEDDGVAKEG